jgi:LacI family transcriptional regulator
LKRRLAKPGISDRLADVTVYIRAVQERIGDYDRPNDRPFARFIAGSRPVKSATIRDVARAAQVSVATVSRALNRSETVSTATRLRVIDAAGELDYVPHSGARSLSTSRTDTIGVMLPDLHGEFFSELIRGIDSATRVHGLHLLLSHSHGDPSEAMAVLRAMRSRVDAMLIMSPYADRELLSAGLNGAAPLVLLGGSQAAHPSFAIDNHAGAFAITTHLLESGYRRIAFVAGPVANLEAEQRLSGYRAALSAQGESFEQVLQGDFGEQSGYLAARQLVEAGVPDAIFAANDTMAIGCLEALREAGLAVPEDVALAGFDNIPVARFLDPPLTTAGVPIAEIGRQAVECCIRILATGEPQAGHVFTPELVIRASSGANIRTGRRAMREEV